MRPVIICYYILPCLHLSCSAVLCDAPPNITNGIVTFTRLTVGSTAAYNCSSGFELVGNMIRTCTNTSMASAEFLPAEPFCRREYTA